jgi:hypothetical protein
MNDSKELHKEFAIKSNGRIWALLDCSTQPMPLATIGSRLARAFTSNGENTSSPRRK